MIKRLEDLLFARRGVVIALFAVISLLMGVSVLSLRVDAGFTKLIPVEHPYMETYLEHRDEFGGADRILLALTVNEGDIFTPGFFEALHHATDAMFFLPGVDRTQVFSILTPNVRYLEIVEDGVIGGNVFPADFEPDESGFSRVRENILKAGLVGRLIANDFSGAIITARLQEFDPGTGERLDYLKVAEQLEDIRNSTIAVSDIGIDVHINGFASQIGEIAAGAFHVAMFFGIAFLITALLVYAHTRTSRSMIALLGCSLLAVVWQLGLLNLLDYGIDPMSILVPFLIFAIGVSHGVQVVNSVQHEMVQGNDSLTAARSSFRRLFRPGFIALVSDAAGFVTISLINVQVIQEIAVAAGLGVAVIILTNLTLLPVLLSYGNRHVRYQTAGNFSHAIRSMLAQAAQPKTATVIILSWTMLTAVGVWVASDVRIGDEHRGVPELRPDSVYNTDARIIGERFSIGVDVLTVITEAKEESCIDYETMRILDDFEWSMGQVEGVQSVVSLAGNAKHLSAAWNEGNLKWQTLPRNRYSLVQSVSPFHTSSGLLNSDCSIMPVYIYTLDHKAETIERVIKTVKAFDAERGGELIRFRLGAGNVGVMAATNEEVEAAQFPIVGYVYAAIILLCLMTFRSVRAVICIVLPLAAVSVLAYALMALLEIGLKVSTLPVVALGVGVGVDYGIYIFSRVHGYLQEGLGFAEAYERTLNTAGAGVLVTGLTLAVGVGTWIVAPLQFQADMGTILMFMFLVNMAGAVILLPALGTWLFRNRVKPKQDNQPDHDTAAVS